VKDVVEIYPKMRPKIGGVYDAEIVQAHCGGEFCVVSSNGGRIVLRRNKHVMEYSEVAADG